MGSTDSKLASQCKEGVQPAPQEDAAAVPIAHGRLALGFFILYCLFVLDFAARYGVTAAFPTIQSDLGLSDSELGWVGSAVLAGMTLFVLPVSYFSDKYDKRRVIAVMGIVWGAGSALAGAAAGFFMLLTGRFMVGAGNAGFAPVSVAMLTSWVRKSRWGLLVGLYNSAMSVGLGVGVIVCGMLVATYGWRSSAYLIGGLSFLFALFALFLPKAAPTNARAGKKITVKKTCRVILTSRTVICILLASAAVSFVIDVIFAWLPSFMVREVGWKPEEVGSKIGMIYLGVGVIVAPLSGIITDVISKFGRQWKIWFTVPCVLGAGLSAYLLFTSHNEIWLIIHIVFMTLPFVAFHTSMQELVPFQYKASSYAAYVIMVQGFGLLGPVVAGALSEKFGLQNALIYVQGCYALSAVLLLLAGFTITKDFARARAMEQSE